MNDRHSIEMPDGCSLIPFSAHSDGRGDLVSFETRKEVPFDIKRVYVISNTINQSTRGYHAHKSLQQLIFCPSGECSITLDDSLTKKEINLNQTERWALLIEKPVWRVIKPATSHTTLVILANEHYDEADYIRNYKEFCAFKTLCH